MESMIDPSSSIPELIKFIKHSFRECEFIEVQNTLMEREKSMNVEMEKVVRDCDELKKQVDFLERSLGYSELEKCDLEEKLRESQKRGDELDKMLVQTNGKFEKLRSEKHDVENELVRSVGKCEEMDERLVKMGKEIEELRRESLSANTTIDELKAKEIEADNVAQELKRQNTKTAAATDAELEKNMQNSEVNPEEDRATESPELPAISGSHASVMQSGGEVPAEKTVASSSAAGKVAIVICDSDSDSDDETRIPDTSSGQTKRRKISTSATPSNCRSLPSSRVEERAGALQKSRTGHRIDSTDSDDSISAGYTNNLIATIDSKGNNKKGTAALAPPRCPLLSPHCSLAPSRCTTPVVEDIIPYWRPQTINVKSQISTYYKTSYLTRVVETLNVVGGEALANTFRQGCFGMLLGWEPGHKYNMALHHVVSRHIKMRGDDDENMWFFINGRRICFSLRDFALVTGLMFGISTFDPTVHHDLSNVIAFRRFCGGQHSSVAALSDIFFDQQHRILDPDGSLYLRVAHLLVLHAFVLGVDLPRPVEPWTWALVDDLYAFSRFPWGAYAYRSLNYWMKQMSPVQKYHFYGPSYALFVWALEVVPGLGAAVGIHTSGLYPRCMRWHFKKSARVDLQPLFEIGGGEIYDLTPDDYELTTDYWQSVAGDNDLGVVFRGPNAFGHRQAQPRYSGGDPSEASIQVELRRRSSRRDSGKRQRLPSSSSSS